MPVNAASSMSQAQLSEAINRFLTALPSDYYAIANTDALKSIVKRDHAQGKRISNPIDTTVLGFIQNAKKFKSTTLGRRVGLTFWLLCGRNL